MFIQRGGGVPRGTKVPPGCTEVPPGCTEVPLPGTQCGTGKVITFEHTGLPYSVSSSVHHELP